MIRLTLMTISSYKASTVVQAQQGSSILCLVHSCHQWLQSTREKELLHVLALLYEGSVAMTRS